ncbi:serine/threonine-protein kinase [Yinghuangia aomiensis]
MHRLDATDPTRVGPYTLLGRLGAGGMGRVYLGRSAAGRTVAVKVVRGELARDAAFRQRFRREVAAARAVSGAFTAPLVDAGADTEVPWLATRFVSGLTLGEAVARRGPLPEAPLRALLAGIAEALESIHATGLVHRDLKPANVMLALDGPHVIDFGIARLMDGTPFTAAGTVMGTPGYMAPEQALAGPTMTASDVFALGATILYAATGVPPFGGGSVPDVLHRVLYDAPDTSAVPAAIRGMVGQCLAKNPEDRPTPRDVIAYVERTGPPASAGSWLPPDLTADIVAMDRVMAGGATPIRPPDPVGTTHEAIAGATTWSRPVEPTDATMPGPCRVPPADGSPDRAGHGRRHAPAAAARASAAAGPIRAAASCSSGCSASARSRSRAASPRRCRCAAAAVRKRPGPRRRPFPASPRPVPGRGRRPRPRCRCRPDRPGRCPRRPGNATCSTGRTRSCGGP